jgi:hypothetical protein
MDLESAAWYMFSMGVGMLIMFIINRQQPGSKQSTTDVPQEAGKPTPAISPSILNTDSGDEEQLTDDDEPLTSNVSVAAALPQKRVVRKTRNTSLTPSQRAAEARKVLDEMDDFKNATIDFKNKIPLLEGKGSCLLQHMAGFKLNYFTASFTVACFN